MCVRFLKQWDRICHEFVHYFTALVVSIRTALRWFDFSVDFLGVPPGSYKVPLS